MNRRHVLSHRFSHLLQAEPPPPARVPDRIDFEEVSRQPRRSREHLIEKIDGPVMLPEVGIDAGEHRTELEGAKSSRGSPNPRPPGLEAAEPLAWHSHAVRP